MSFTSPTMVKLSPMSTPQPKAHPPPSAGPCWIGRPLVRCQCSMGWSSAARYASTLRKLRTPAGTPSVGDAHTYLHNLLSSSLSSLNISEVLLQQYPIQVSCNTLERNET